MVEIFDDIRKLYRFYVPGNELADSIEFFSESCPETTRLITANGRFTVKMFPSWTPTLWINFGPPYLLQMGTGSWHIPSGQGVLLTRDLTAERFNQPADHLFSIKFHPGGLENVLGINQSCLNGTIASAQAFFPGNWMETVKRAGSFESRVRLCEAHFLRQLRKRKKGEHYLNLVKQTIATYQSTGMVYNVNQLSERLFVTSKSIGRYFQKAVGTTPKRYFSALRARTALTHYLRRSDAFNPCAFGYFDMSHFYKSVESFTGRPLSGWRDAGAGGDL